MRSSGQSCCCRFMILQPAKRPRSTSSWNWSDTDVKISAWMARLSALLLLSALNGAWVPPGLAQADPVFAAAGDIACDPADESFNGGAGTAHAPPPKNPSGLFVEMKPPPPLGLRATQHGEAAPPHCVQSLSGPWGRVRYIT